jgi:hypothetical protein
MIERLTGLGGGGGCEKRTVKRIPTLRTRYGIAIAMGR